jgi:hypothetical protein
MLRIIDGPRTPMASFLPQVDTAARIPKGPNG